MELQSNSKSDRTHFVAFYFDAFLYNMDIFVAEIVWMSIYMLKILFDTHETLGQSQALERKNKSIWLSW